MLNIDWSELNKVLVDKFGRVNGIFAFDKPKGITSHDLVDQVRRKLGTRRVGHAGALDPFATGLMLILVGRYTKKTEFLMKLDKTYTAQILFGVGTNSGDIDGEVENIDNKFELMETELNKVIENLNEKYIQYVPIFSSVKIDGIKLREAARSSSSFEIVKSEPKRVKFILDERANSKLKSKAEEGVVDIEVPSKEVTVDIRLKKIEKVVPANLGFEIFNNITEEFYSAEIEVDCSKGTYIRQLAMDLGEMLGTSGVLYGLIRNRIGEVELEQTMKIEDLKM